MLSLNALVLSNFHTMSWLKCATFACMSHYITLLFSLNNSFVVRSCKSVVTFLINFLCYVVLCCVVLCCVVLCCVVLCCVVLCCVVLCCVVLCCVVLCCVVLCCVVLFVFFHIYWIHSLPSCGDSVTRVHCIVHTKTT